VKLFININVDLWKEEIESALYQWNEDLFELTKFNKTWRDTFNHGIQKSFSISAYVYIRGGVNWL